MFSAEIDWTLVVFGTAIVAFSIYEIWLIFASMRWERTPGVVIEVAHEKYGLDIGWRHREITYSFEVNGYNYVSTKYTPGTAARFVFRLPFLPHDFFASDLHYKGNEVIVRYDPKNPRRCAIKDGDVVWPTVLGIIGVAMAVCGVAGAGVR